MPSDLELKRQIEANLGLFRDSDDLRQNALRFFETLGYESDKKVELHPNNPDGFKAFLKQNSAQLSNEKKAYLEEWEKVEFLFQLTDEEIGRSKSLFDSDTVDVSDTKIESYLFFAIKLKSAEYRRSELAEITRELNRTFPMPVMILFQHGNTLTFSIIDRRLHKRDESKDVLLKITLIKDIRLENPHRAHIEILADLALEGLNVRNFVELHKAWQKVLDTKELNKKFFQELANWYFWAIENVTFPDDDEKDKEIRNATSVIRLITRLMFVWFLKEKGLVSEKLFDEKYLKTLLHFKDKSTFYKAILQNLFFATLNSEMGTRKFIADSFQGKNMQHFVHNVFRYKKEFIKPEETLTELFEPIPFLNGGLFECLDKETEVDGTKCRVRVDGFSDHPKNVLKIPDELFFGAEDEIDLNEIYGTRNKHYKVRGLINILESYKFTITENTPIEEEIALDPELLGKVFENLLASYNPETKTTARKQTGSFYTPREIVNYMVDESLIAYLKAKLETDAENRWQGKAEELEAALRDLFSYAEDKHSFNENETKILVKAIGECKILDPACGSGAFPMGILLKLVHILQRLDPDNEQWMEFQLEKAIADSEKISEQIEDQQEREKHFNEIYDVFTNNSEDYGRKLYLVENCIYGVDIQPIAIQIAKLRFFISLIVDQKMNAEKENLGIRPLPNLETKFVAANTLIGLEAQGGLKPEKANYLEKELKEVRAKHFSARTRKTKENHRKKDKEIRLEIADLLKQGGIKADIADQIAEWNPYDQNASADWFDAEYMFGIEKGFDIVIGNPPYLRVQGLQQSQPEMIPIYRERFKSAQGSFDIYALFIECGYSFLCNKGQFSYIVPHKFLNAAFGKALRVLLGRGKALRQIVKFGAEQVFDEATTYTCLLFLSKQSQNNFDLIEVSKISENERIFEIVGNNGSSKNYQREILESPQTDDWDFQIGDKNKVLKKLQNQPVKLGDITRKIFQGIATSADKIFVLQNLQEKNDSFVCYSRQLESEIEIEKGLVKPFLMGKDVHRYEYPKAKNVVIFPYHLKESKAELMSQKFIRDNFPKGWKYLLENKSTLAERERGRFEKDWHCFSRPQNLTEFANPKIMTPEIALGCQMTFDKEGTLYHTTKVYSFVFKDNYKSNTSFLIGLLNSKVLWFFLSSTGYVLRGGYYTFKTNYLSPFPIPKATDAQQTAIAEIVDEIIEAKKQAPNVDTRELEFKIDKLVYQLYGLTDEEIRIVEGKEKD